MLQSVYAESERPDGVIDIFCRFSYDDIIDPSNKITKFLDDVHRKAVELHWADPPGDLRYPGDGMPKPTLLNPIIRLKENDQIGLCIEITLNSVDRTYSIRPKFILDSGEWHKCINDQFVNQITCKMQRYDGTREDLQLMVMLKHYIHQSMYPIIERYGLMEASRDIRVYSWLTRDQRLSILHDVFKAVSDTTAYQRSLERRLRNEND